MKESKENIIVYLKLPVKDVGKKNQPKIINDEI